MTIPNLRTDTKGHRGGKRGKPALSLPTQSLDDKALYIDVSYRPEEAVRLPAYFSPHPKFPDCLLVNMEPFVGDDNNLSVRQTYRKVPFPTSTTIDAFDPRALGAESTTVAQIVKIDTPLPEPTFKTLAATKRQIDANFAEISVTSVEDFPILEGTNTDPHTGVVVKFKKTIVAAGTTGGIIDGWYVDVEPVDRLRSIWMAQRIDATKLPSAKTFKHTVQKSFPAQLVDQYFIAFIANDGLRADGRVKHYVKLKDPFTAACEASTVRTYSMTPPSSTESETPFNPESCRIDAVFVNASGNLIESSGIIPSCLHGELNERWGSFQVLNGWQGISDDRPLPLQLTECFITPFAEGPIPATKPSQLTPGETFIHRVNTSEGRMGLWIKEVTTAKIPTHPSEE